MKRFNYDRFENKAVKLIKKYNAGEEVSMMFHYSQGDKYPTKYIITVWHSNNTRTQTIRDLYV
jgi:hypothetical protein